MEFRSRAPHAGGPPDLASSPLSATATGTSRHTPPRHTLGVAMRRDHPPPGREIATSRRAAHITAQHRADATAGALHPSSRPRRGTRCLGLRRRLVPDDRDPRRTQTASARAMNGCIAQTTCKPNRAGGLTSYPRSCSCRASRCWFATQAIARSADRRTTALALSAFGAQGMARIAPGARASELSEASRSLATIAETLGSRRGCRADLAGRPGRGVRGGVGRGSATRVGSVGGGGPGVWGGVSAEGLF